MKINALIFGLAGSITIGIIYSLFTLLLKVWPASTIKFIGTIHMLPKLELISPYIKVTSQTIILGITSHVVIGFIVFWLIATLYNKLQK